MSYIIVDDDITITDLITEMVERKGIGHPDTLSDLIAETFSNKYSKYCQDKFGVVLNHWVDKVLLAGGTAKINFGHTKITRPITAYLFGRVVQKIDNEKIDILALFKESVEDVFSNIFDTDILKYTRYKVDVNCGIGKDHSKEYYFPKKANDVKTNWEKLISNDTVICTGFAPYTETERLAVDLENFCTGKDFKKSFPETGWDVKVMIVRYHKTFEITICLPFIADRTPSFQYYQDKLTKAKESIDKKIRELMNDKYQIKDCNVNLYINTKDKGEYVYLTAFGTALDKGDYGAVGRGNKYQGFISLNRETNIEAVCGKNPVNHSGKLYTILANDLSWKIHHIIGCPVKVNISARNGDPIYAPQNVFVRVGKKLDDNTKSIINDLIDKSLKDPNSLTEQILNNNPVTHHINHKFYL